MEAMNNICRSSAKSFEQLVELAAKGVVIGCCDSQGVHHGADWLLVLPDGSLIVQWTNHRRKTPKIYAKEYLRIFYFEERVFRGMMRPFLSRRNGQQVVRVWTNGWQCDEKRVESKSGFIRWLTPPQTYCWRDTEEPTHCGDTEEPTHCGDFDA